MLKGLRLFYYGRRCRCKYCNFSSMFMILSRMYFTHCTHENRSELFTLRWYKTAILRIKWPNVDKNAHTSRNINETFVLYAMGDQTSVRIYVENGLSSPNDVDASFLWVRWTRFWYLESSMVWKSASSARFLHISCTNSSNRLHARLHVLALIGANVGWGSDCHANALQIKSLIGVDAPYYAQYKSIIWAIMLLNGKEKEHHLTNSNCFSPFFVYVRNAINRPQRLHNDNSLYGSLRINIEYHICLKRSINGCAL